MNIWKYLLTGYLDYAILIIVDSENSQVLLWLSR